MPQATILIAEDDVNLADILKAKLAALGYNVLVAHDGEAAEQFIMKDQPDLSLLDIMMPKKSGLEVLESVSQKPEMKSLAVMMLSNLAQKQDIDKAQTMGAKEYIVKANTSLAEIVQKLDTFLKANPPKERAPVEAAKKQAAPEPVANGNGNWNGNHPAEPPKPPVPQQQAFSQPVALQQLPQQPVQQYPQTIGPFYPVICITPAPNQPPQYYYLVPLPMYPPQPPPPQMGSPPY